MRKFHHNFLRLTAVTLPTFPFIYLPTQLSTFHTSTHPSSIHLPTYLHTSYLTYLSAQLPVHVPIHLPTYFLYLLNLPVCLIYLPVFLRIHLPIHLSIHISHTTRNEASGNSYQTLRCVLLLVHQHLLSSQDINKLLPHPTCSRPLGPTGGSLASLLPPFPLLSSEVLRSKFQPPLGVVLLQLLP